MKFFYIVKYQGSEKTFFFFFFALLHLPSYFFFFFSSWKIKETTLVDFCERILWCIHRVERMRVPFKPSLLLRSTLLFLITVPFYIPFTRYLRSIINNAVSQTNISISGVWDDWLLLLVNLFIDFRQRNFHFIA